MPKYIIEEEVFDELHDHLYVLAGFLETEFTYYRGIILETEHPGLKKILDVLIAPKESHPPETPLAPEPPEAKEWLGTTNNGDLKKCPYCESQIKHLRPHIKARHPDRLLEWLDNMAG